jgi:3-oxoacyl-[acyl-carrier protein] reductase
MKQVLIVGSDSDIAKRFEDYLRKRGYAEPIRLNRENCDLEGYFNIMNYINKPIDLLIFAAGVNTRLSVIEERKWLLNKTFSVNLISPLSIVSTLARLKMLTSTANIMFLGSVLGRIPKSKSMAYGISKGALEIAVKYLAKELHPIRVNNVALGFIDTKWHKGKSKKDLAGIEKEILMKRMGTVEDACHAMEFIMNNDYLTGQTIVVDGGFSL